MVVFDTSVVKPVRLSINFSPYDFGLLGVDSSGVAGAGAEEAAAGLSCLEERRGSREGCGAGAEGKVFLEKSDISNNTVLSSHTEEDL